MLPLQVVGNALPNFTTHAKMKGTIYLIQNDDTLVPMNEQAYDSEAHLQILLENYPNLLAGDQINVDAPRRWLLIGREFGVPDQENGSNRWALDHLFVDQDAVPTLVEVKRSTDTRTRREVVAQMLDYAANGTAYWPGSSIRAGFEALCRSKNQRASDLVAELLQSPALEDDEIEAFWQQVQANLAGGRLRLIFVADEIPLELRRIVEYLNEQMHTTEVLAVEIKQYVGRQLRTLVPRVIGQTARSQQEKGNTQRQKRKWDRESFIKALLDRNAPQYVPILDGILRWANDRQLRIWWGEGMTTGSCYPMYSSVDRWHHLFSVKTDEKIQIEFGFMKAPFDSEEYRMMLLEKLNAIPGMNIERDRVNAYPGFGQRVLEDEKHLNRFLDAFDWYMEEIRKYDSIQMQRDIG